MAKQRVREYQIRDWDALWEQVKQYVLEWPNDVPSYEGISKQINIPTATLKYGLRKYGINSAADLSKLRGDLKENKEESTRTPSDKDSQALVMFLDKKKSENVDWRSIVTHAQKTQEFAEAMDDTQRIANVHIPTDHPIAVMFSADWHLGDMATDHKQWAADMEWFLKTDDLFGITMGDLYQNMRSFRNLSAVIWQAIPPPMQGAMIRSIIDEMTEKEKLLALVMGNHDGEFDERIFGEHVHNYLLNNLKAPKFQNRGLLKLKVGKVTYNILVFHKSRFRSFLRAGHSAYREYELSYPGDIVAGAHDHISAFEMMEHYTLAYQAGETFGGRSYLVKVGSYQDSSYGWKYFHGAGSGPGNITAVLFPDQKKIVMFEFPNDALVYMKHLK